MCSRVGFPAWASNSESECNCLGCTRQWFFLLTLFLSQAGVQSQWQLSRMHRRVAAPKTGDASSQNLSWLSCLYMPTEEGSTGQGHSWRHAHGVDVGSVDENFLYYNSVGSRWSHKGVDVFSYFVPDSILFMQVSSNVLNYNLQRIDIREE